MRSEVNGVKLGVVAWFTANRVFNTQIGNFSVVEIDGHLDVTMDAGQGTVLDKANNSVSVRNNSTDLASAASFTRKTTSQRTGIASPTANQLVYDTELKKMMRWDAELETPDWVDAELITGKVYTDEEPDPDVLYVATGATSILEYGPKQAVLTHGSLNHADGHAYVIDNDSDPNNPTYIDKKLDAGINWLQKADVTIEDSDPANEHVDVYNVVSWKMTFTYTFAGDSAPIAVYLDLAKSRFVDVNDPDPDFTKAGDGKHKTSKGFRIGFYGEGHDVVWGNNDPLMNVPSAYAKDAHYYIGSIVKNDGKYYKAKTEIASAPTELAPASWDEIHDYLPEGYNDQKAYAVGSKVVRADKVYKCKTPIADPSPSTHAWDEAEWEDLSIPADYAPSATHKEGEKAIIAGKVYKCTADHNDTSGFVSANWAETYEVTLDSTTKGISAFAKNTPYSVGDKVVRNNIVYSAKGSITNDHDWKASEWEVYRDTDLKYVSSETTTTLYNETNYVTSKDNYVKLDNLDANEKKTFGNMSAPERICVLDPGHSSMTINCAAWFEGTDPNVVSGAVMECLKAEMSFYSRTVNLDA